MKRKYIETTSNRGSIKECNISHMEYIEYKQTGMIKIKESPVSRGEIQRLKSNKDLSYYDWLARQERTIDFFDLY